MFRQSGGIVTSCALNGGGRLSLEAKGRYNAVGGISASRKISEKLQFSDHLFGRWGVR